MAKVKRAAKVPTRRGRPAANEVESRNARLLDAATEVFLEAGFPGAKMNEIARRAGASMETLYSRYPNKAELFAALIERKSSRLLHAVGSLSPEREPEEALSTYGLELVGMMSKPDTQSLHRLVIAGAIESPELGALFWKAGPGRGFKILRGYLSAQVERGTMVMADVDRATGLLMAMLVGGLALRSTLGLRTFLASRDDQREWVRYVVNGFLQLPK